MKAKSTEEKIEELKNRHSKFFNKTELFYNFALAGLYLVTFEVLKSSVVDNLRGFFSRGETDIRQRKPDRYREVLDSYFKKYDGEQDCEYQACCHWLMDQEVINGRERALLMEIKAHRNMIAHELPRVLFEPQTNIDLSLLIKANEMVRKLDTWRALNVDVPADSAYDGKTITENDIDPVRSMLLSYMYEEFLKISEEILGQKPRASS